MSTDEVLNIVKRRGLTLTIATDGRPVIKNGAGNPNVTDKLLAVLKIHRDRIIERLRPS